MIYIIYKKMNTRKHNLYIVFSACAIEDLLSRRIVWHWEHVKPIALEARQHLNDPTQYDHFEFLYNEMKKRIEQTRIS